MPHGQEDKYKCKDVAVRSRSQAQLKYARGVMLSVGEECSQEVKKAAGSTVEHTKSRIQRQEGSELETALLPVKPFLCVC